MERLVAALDRDDPIARDAAIARLRILGTRAVGRLARAAAEGAVHTRTAALRALDGIDDPRVVGILLPLLRDDDVAIRTAVVTALKPWVTREAGTQLLDTLTALALDREQPGPVRLGALDALSDLPRHIVAPILEQVPATTDATIALDDPSAVREWLSSHGSAPLSELHDLIVHAREQGRRDAGRRRLDWLVTRGAIHAVLARRGSRVAVYDLREAFDAASAPLPLDFLTAITALGDADCLEPLARAWAAVPKDEWWRSRVADAAGEIVRRHHLTARSTAIKRIRVKWPGLL